MTIPARSSGPGSSEPLLLAIETAGSGCSAAILRGSEALATEHRALRHGHAEALLPMIDRVARAAAVEPRALDIVAAAIGPGGFTGIRAGLAAAQGIALASGARLVGVTSFAAVAAMSRTRGPDWQSGPVGRARNDGARALLVALDSRRDDLYVQLFDRVTAEPANRARRKGVSRQGSVVRHGPLSPAPGAPSDVGLPVLPRRDGRVGRCERRWRRGPGPLPA